MAHACSSLITPCARVLVAGGTGVVGSGVVQALLKQGAKVIVGTRSMDNFNALSETVPANLKCSLSSVVGDVRTEDGAKSVFDQVTGDCAGVQHVIASLKGHKTMWQSGRMWDQSLNDFYDGSAEEVTGHFLLMRSFLPYLEKVQGSTYTILTGYPINECPQPGVPNSLVCLAAGTVHGLADGARAEHSDSCVAVNEIYLKCTVYKQLDCEVSSLGSMHLGNDLVGSVVAAVAGAGARKKVKIHGREDAMSWTSPGGAPSQYPCPPPCPAPQRPVCGH